MTAEVKWAVKRNAAHCLSGPVARARIAEGVKKGMDLALRKLVQPVLETALRKRALIPA